MRVVNLTPHAIVVRLNDGTDKTYPPSGQVARLPSKELELPALDGVPVVRTSYGAPEGLPPGPLSDVAYLVSALVAAQCLHRPDVFAPDTGPASVVRDEAGKIVAVQRFLRY